MTLVFWLFLRTLVSIMIFLLTSVALNIGKVFLILIFVFVLPDSGGIDASGRILTLTLLSEFFSTKTMILILLGLCRWGLSPIWWRISRKILGKLILFKVPGIFVILLDRLLTSRASRIHLSGPRWNLEAGLGLGINGLINNLIPKV